MTDLKEANLSESCPPPELPWTESPPIEDKVQPPKDGKQGWIVVVGAFCATLCTLGATTSFGVSQSGVTYLTDTGIPSILRKGAAGRPVTLFYSLDWRIAIFLSVRPRM
jgi:hypothetical protein